MEDFGVDLEQIVPGLQTLSLSVEILRADSVVGLQEFVMACFEAVTRSAGANAVGTLGFIGEVSTPRLSLLTVAHLVSGAVRHSGQLDDVYIISTFEHARALGYFEMKEVAYLARC